MPTAPRPAEPATPRATAPARNPGTPLELSVFSRLRVNRGAVERRAATLGKRRTVKKKLLA